MRILVLDKKVLLFFSLERVFLILYENCLFEILVCGVNIIKKFSVVFKSYYD